MIVALRRYLQALSSHLLLVLALSLVGRPLLALAGFDLCVSVAVCFSLWVVVKPSPGRNSPCTPIKPSSAATPQGPRLRSLDLAPVSPAAGRGFLLAQRLRRASTKLGAVSSLVLWRRVGCSLIRSTHLRSVVGLELLRSHPSEPTLHSKAWAAISARETPVLLGIFLGSFAAFHATSLMACAIGGTDIVVANRVRNRLGVRHRRYRRLGRIRSSTVRRQTCQPARPAQLMNAVV